MVPSFSGNPAFPSTNSYSSSTTPHIRINYSLLHEMPQGDILVPISISSSRSTSTTTNSVVDNDHVFPRRRSSSTSRLCTSSSSRGGLNLGSRGNGVNRGSIRKVKVSSERLGDSVAAAKQCFSIAPNSGDRTMQGGYSDCTYPRLHHLPVEIHAKILRLLDPLDVLAYARTCKRFQKYGDGQQLWYVICNYGSIRSKNLYSL